MGSAWSRRLDWLESFLRPCRQLYANRITGGDLAADDDEAHHPGFSHRIAFRIATETGSHQARLEFIKLVAWVSQPGDLHNHLGSDPQYRAAAEPQKVYTPRGDILAHEPRANLKPKFDQLVVKFGVEQMNLPQIGLGRIPGYPAAMLHRSPEMSIAFHTVACDQPNDGAVGFVGAMGRLATDGDNRGRRHELGDLVTTGAVGSTSGGAL